MMNPPVFFGAGGFVLAVIVFGGIWTSTATIVFETTLHFITTYFGWYYVLIVFFFLLFVIWLFFSPYGGIRLGKDNEQPEFSKLAWFTMLFAAGMGMGLIFYGVAEPIEHYYKPPTADPETAGALKEAMRFSFVHWGFHPWAIYIIFGAGIAYFHFRVGLPLAPRSLLYPIFGNNIKGVLGHVTDAFCTVGTLLGVATSLGLGAMQINSALKSLLTVPYNIETQILITIIITAVAVTSTISGLGRGIKYLSMTNLAVMFLLMLFVFFAGPTLYIVKLFITSLGDYIHQFIPTSLWLDPRANSEWQTNWTLFYWGWWISWCPFVGVFIARISKGRTIREFVFYVFLVPTIVTFLWFSIFGGTALYLDIHNNAGIHNVVDGNLSMSLNALLDELPIAIISKWLGLLLVIIFFITSSDSGSLVDDMVTSGGHPDPPVLQRAFWGISEGAAAATLLLAGGLQALQTAAISSGLPQSFLVIATAIALVKALRVDGNTQGVPHKEDFLKKQFKETKPFRPNKPLDNNAKADHETSKRANNKD